MRRRRAGSKCLAQQNPRRRLRSDPAACSGGELLNVQEHGNGVSGALCTGCTLVAAAQGGCELKMWNQAAWIVGLGAGHGPLIGVPICLWHLCTAGDGKRPKRAMWHCVPRSGLDGDGSLWLAGAGWPVLSHTFMVQSELRLLLGITIELSTMVQKVRCSSVFNCD